MNSKSLSPLVLVCAILGTSCKSENTAKTGDESLQAQKVHARFADSPDNILDHKTERYGKRESRPDLEAVYEAFLEGEDVMAQHVRDLLAKDETEALNIMADLEAELNYEVIGKTLFEHFQEKEDMEAGLAAFEILNRNPTLASPLLSEFLDAYWQEKPEDALKWAKGHGSFNGVEAATQRIGEYVGKSADPASGIKVMLDESIPDNVRSFYIASAVENWAKNDLNAAFEFMSDIKPHPAYNETYYTMVNSSAKLDPESAMEWASLITDYGLKTSAIQEISSNWKTSDPDGYSQWEASQQAEQ